MDGFLFVDKEKGESSFDVVRKVRRLSGTKKVGHSGTLDPLATGLLILAIGKATKLLEFMIGMDKEYKVEAKFGAVSSTYDAEGEILEQKKCSNIERGYIEDKMKKFIDEISQLPPAYSALKINGKKAYELAREGKEPKLKSRKVKIYDFKIVSYKWPFVEFLVRCGSGTYIRSLIHDLGMELGCGAYVNELRRTMIASISVNKALSLSESDELCEQHLQKIEDIARLLPIDGTEIDSDEFEILRKGQSLLNIKIEQGLYRMAYLNDKLVGVLESAKGDSGVKFRKMI